MPDGQKNVNVGMVLRDPNFQQLPLAEKNKVLLRIDPNFKSLSPQAQEKVLDAVHYGKPQKPPSELSTAARELALGGLSGYTGLPESAHPVKDALKSLTHPSKLELAADLTGTAPLLASAGIAKNLYGAGKDLLTSKETGPTAHGLGSLIGQILQLKSVLSAPEAARSEATTPKLLRPIETLQGGPVGAGIEDVFRASQPGAGSRNINLRENVEVAKNDLAEIQRETPLEGKGGIIRPDKRLRNFASNVTDYLDDLWQEQVNPQINRWKDATVNVRPLKRAMLDTITPTDRESSPTGVRAVERWVERMPDTDTLGGLAERRKTINAYLRGFEGKSAGEQSTAMRTKPLVEALKSQDQAIVRQMFGELKARGEPGMDNLERRYAALADLRDAASSQMNAAETFRMLDRLRFYFSPGKLFGARDYMGATPTAGKLMERGLKRFKRGGLEAPPVTGPGDRILPPTNRQLPPAGGRSAPNPAADPTLGRQAPGGPNTQPPPIRLGGQGPVTALLKIPGQAPVTVLISREGILEGSPKTPVPQFPEPANKLLPAVRPQPGAGVPPSGSGPTPMRQLEIMAEGPWKSRSFPEGEQGPTARVVGTGRTRHLEIWDVQQQRWIPMNVNLSGEK